ncbi:MAG TPA: NAD(P)-dependent alcohol dehydrogenase, partial [Spirochaetota bacterium]|nr:NAD(P)-dependent alcohol dehydrogenase [Spirochaetota bacterium]
MKAVMCKKYGGPEVTEIVEVEKPVCKNNDVLIKIKSFTVTLPDCAFRKGEPFIARFFSGLSKPKFIPGDILAGIIEEIGKNVTLFKKGDEVYGCTGTSFGAHAEYISLNENSVLVKKPDNLSFEEASGLCYEGLTGLPFLRDNAHIKQGDKILIIGASSSVGLSAVQLAKYYGAYVTGVSSAKNLNIVKSLGAQKVIDYTKEDYTIFDRMLQVLPS